MQGCEPPSDLSGAGLEPELAQAIGGSIIERGIATGFLEEDKADLAPVVDSEEKSSGRESLFGGKLRAKGGRPGRARVKFL
jgi:hypothetical protein